MQNDLVRRSIYNINTECKNSFILAQYMKNVLHVSHDIMSNIRICCFILFTEYTNNIVDRIYKLINRDLSSKTKFTYVMLIHDNYYPRFLEVFKKDQFNDFYLIKTDSNYKSCLYTVLFTIKDYTDDFLYVRNLDLQDQEKNIYKFIENSIFDYFSMGNKNVLYAIKKYTNISSNKIDTFIKQHRGLHKIV